MIFWVVGWAVFSTISPGSILCFMSCSRITGESPKQHVSEIPISKEKMRDGVPSCFSGESRGKTSENLVASTYKMKLGGRSRVITVTWCKNGMGQDLCVAVGESLASRFVCKVEMKPWNFWRKQGSWKSSDIIDGNRVEVFWNLGSAKFVAGPEPERGYYVAVVWNEEMVLLLGDMEEEAYRKTKSRASVKAVLVSREEHVLGKECFATVARFGDEERSHEVSIECQTKRAGDPALVISVDRELAVEVKHLLWKFRGNGTIYVEGVPVEILWDVHDWLFNPGLGHHALFYFKSMMQPLDSPTSKDMNDCGIPSDFCLLINAWA